MRRANIELINMKAYVIFVVLFICTRNGYSKNLDEIPAVKVSNSTTISPATAVESTNASPIQSTPVVSTPSTQTAEKITPAKEPPTTSDVIIKSPGANASFIDNLSDQIRLVLKHFQNADPMGIPGNNILPEPMVAENVSASMVVVTGNFYDITIYGLNNFSIDVVNTFLDQMEVFVVLKLKTVTALGQYTMTNLLIDSQGPFNITFNNVTAAGIVGLVTNDEGKLYANKSAIDIAYETIEVDLTNVSSLVKPFLNTGGSHVFDAEKPLILETVNKRLLAEIDRRLEFFPRIPPLAKLSPVDLAVLEARRYVRAKYEPFTIAKVFDFDNSFLNVHVGPVVLNGISRFARVGNITLAMANQTVDLKIRMITQKILGHCKWYYDIGKVGVTRHGQSNFSVEHLQFEARVLQPIDSRKSPVLEELDIETGPIAVKMDGLGSFDYLVEMVAKMLPKMLRHLIVDSLEEVIKDQIQIEVLNKINVEQVYEENLPDLKQYLSDKKYI